MFAEVLFWAGTAAALPLGRETVCNIEGRSFSDGGRHICTLIRRVLVERQNSDSNSSSSSGPALGVILGGVFGVLGGLAIAGVIFYAWWSVRRMRSKYGASDVGGGSSTEPSSSTSRGSSSKSKSKSKPRPKDGPKWQDPWLAPPPKSPRTHTAMKFHAPTPVDVAKLPGPQDDRASDSSAIPLKMVYPSDDKQ